MLKYFEDDDRKSVWKDAMKAYREDLETQGVSEWMDASPSSDGWVGIATRHLEEVKEEIDCVGPKQIKVRNDDSELVETTVAECCYKWETSDDDIEYYRSLKMQQEIWELIVDPKSILHQLLTGKSEIYCPICKREVTQYACKYSAKDDDDHIATGCCPLCSCSDQYDDHNRDWFWHSEKCKICEGKCYQWEEAHK